MNEALPILIPLEDNASVYPIVFPGESLPLTADGQSFFDVLLSQFAPSVGTGEEQVFTDFLTLALPVVPAQGDQVVSEALPEEMTSELLTAESLLSTTPLPVLATSDDMILPTGEGQDVIAQEVPPAIAPLIMPEQVNLEDVGTVVADTTDEGVQSEMIVAEPLIEENLTRVMTEVAAQARTPLETVFEQVTSEQTTEQMPVLQMKEVPTEAQPSPEVVRPEMIFTTEMPQVRADQAPIEQRDVYEQPDPLAFLHEESFKFVPERPESSEAVVEHNAFMQFVQNKSEQSQLLTPAPEPVSATQQLFSDTAATVKVDETVNTAFSFSQESEQFSLSERPLDMQTSADTSERSEFSEIATPAFEESAESPSAERVRQVEEAQSIAQQLVKSAQLRQSPNVTEFTLSLEPEYLGTLKISVALEGETIHTRIAADSAYTREVLVNNLTLLKESFENAGIKFDEVEVSMDDNSSAFEFAHEHTDAQSGKSHASNEHEQPFIVPGYEIETASMSDDTAVVASMSNGFHHVNYLA